MNALGSLSQIYMFILLVLLFLGFGLAIWGFANFLITRKEVIKKSILKGPILKGTSQSSIPATMVRNEKLQIKKIGGFIMNSNGWIKLAVFSFVGIIVSVIVLGFISTGSNAGINHTGQQTHQQGVQGQTGTSSTMGNMQNGLTNDQITMQQQLNQMQQNMMLMQQQMMMMQGGTGGMSTQNSMSNMGTMPTQNSMSNMGTMPQSGNSGMSMDSMMNMMNMMQMQQQNMSNMPTTAPATMPAMPMM